MYSYHEAIIWAIDMVLVAAAVLLGAYIVLYTVLKEVNEVRSLKKLALIKENMKRLAQSGQKAVKNACPSIIGKVTPQQFLEIAKDREIILPEEFEQALKYCLVASGKVADIEKVARSSRNKWRRIQALISLGYADSPSALEILKNAIEDKDEDVSYYSMVALGQIKTNASARILLDFLGKHAVRGNRIVSFLERFPSSAVDEVARAIDSKNPVVRFWAIKLISKFKAESYVKKIETLTGDESADVRAAACECLGKIRSRGSKDALARCLSDKVWFVRMHAVRALAAILCYESMPIIVPLMKDEAWFVRDSVKKAMTCNIEASLPYIEEYIREGDESLKKDCVEVIENALWGLGNEPRKNILQAVARIDKTLAEHIDKTMNAQIAEAK